MSDCNELFFDVLEALQSLAESIGFLFSGLSFGLIPTVRNIEEESDNARFCLIIGRASQSLYSIYLVISLIFAMYYDYNSVYNIIMSTLGLFVSIWYIYLIKKKNNDAEEQMAKTIENNPNNPNNEPDEAQTSKANKRKTTEVDIEDGGGFTARSLFWVSTVILNIRLILNSYFYLQKRANITSGTAVFESTQMSMDCFCLLLFTLALQLPLLVVEGDTKKEGKRILTVWAMEYGDIIAHLTVCILYVDELTLNSFTDDGYLLAYFIVYCINIVLFTLPLPWTSFYAKTYHPMIIHTMLLDLATDLPFTIITLVGKTYVGNFFITIDVVINLVTFIRGLVWVPIKFKTKEFDTKSILQNMLLGIGGCLAALVALSVVLAPGTWLVYNGFTIRNDCHNGTNVNVKWDVWFHIMGWSYFVCLPAALAAEYGARNRDDLIALVSILCYEGSLNLMHFLMAAIGLAMWHQSSESCQESAAGYTIIAYSIVCMIISVILFAYHMFYIVSSGF